MAPCVSVGEVSLTNRAGALLALVVAGTALVVIDMTVMTIALPAIRDELGGDQAGVQWVIIGYMIAMGAVTQVVGSMSDRIGRRRIYLAGVVVFTAASLACALAPTVLALNVGRVAQGLGGAVLMVNALPLLAHRFDGAKRAMAISTWGSAASAAGLVAPLLGGLLVDGPGWRSVFMINVPIGAGAFVLGWLVLQRETAPAGRRGPIDWAGTALLVAALGIVTVALLRGPVQGWGSAATLVQLGLAVGLLAAFLVVERRASEPVLALDLFRVQAFTGAALAVFMSRVLTIGGTVYLVQYLDETAGLTPTQSGLLLTPVFVAQMVAGMVGGKLLGSVRPGWVLAGGYAAKAVAAAWLALALAGESTPVLLVAPLLLWGAGGGIAGVPVMAVAMAVVPKERAGMVAGVISSLAAIGAGVGTAALGAVFAGAGAAAVLATSAGLAVLTTLAVLGLVRMPALPGTKAAARTSSARESA